MEEGAAEMTSPLLGVCSWAIDRHDILGAIEVAGTIPELSAIQIGFFSQAVVQEADPEAIARAASAAGLRITSSFVAFEGEDYGTIERIAVTGGYAFDEAYERRLDVTRAVAEITRQMGADAVAVHVGTIPRDRSDSLFDKLVTRCAEVADTLAGIGVQLHIETGREPAAVLRGFLDEVGRGNVAINFDPGNFVVYGTDDPREAFVELADCVRVLHLKDASRSATPGVDYGRPAPLGAGDAKIARIISKMRLFGDAVPVLIECSSGDAGEQTVRSSVHYVRTLLP